MRDHTGRTARTADRGALLLTVALLAWPAHELVAQTGGYAVTGVVRAEEGEPVGQAQVFIPAVGKGTLTDSEGRFTLRGLAAGRHVVHVARIGYAPVREEVRLGGTGGGGELEITLVETPLSLPGVQVTGTTGSQDPLAVAQATTQLAGRALERELGGTIAHTLKAQPGVAMRNMGPGATLPVMRGLTGDRILVLQDGQRTADLAGSADDHGVTIDPLVAERVEVVRGPATLLYGNNALGGVVNVISGDIPSHVPERPEWRGGVQTETAYPGAALSGRATVALSERWAITMRGGGRRTADMRIPEDPVLGSRLENTDTRNWSGSVGVGYVGESVTGGASLQTYDFAYGLPVPPDADPVSLRGRRYDGSGRAEISLGSAIFPAVRLDGAMQEYTHDELDDLTGVVAQRFALDTRTANVLLRQGRLGPIAEGAWGVSGLFKSYAATGSAALTPPADSRGVGVFGFQEISMGGPALQLGVRYDQYSIASHDSEKFGRGHDRTFRAASGSIGLRLPIAEGVSTGVSVARSFRAPTVEELFSGAAHAGTGAVEFGNPLLRAERGVSLEAVVRVQNARWHGQIAGFRNEIRDYVHLVAHGDTLLAGVRLPVLMYDQEQAVLQGFEGSLEWAASRELVLGFRGDYLHAQQVNDVPLSFMPPARVGLLAHWDGRTFSLGGDVHHEFRQDRVGTAEEMPTPAHTILRLYGGLRFELAGQQHSLTLRAENPTNELHREATSRIKDFAPGPGRSLAILYRVQR